MYGIYKWETIFHYFIKFCQKYLDMQFLRR